MKRYRNILLVLFAFVLSLILPACGGGGGGGGGGGTPVTGTKPVAIYSDNAVVVGTTATVSGMVNPNGAGTYRFVLTDSLGGRQEKLPQSIGGSILQPVQAVFSGLNPVATNTVTVEATNTYGTANDFGIFPTWSTPPAIIGSAVTNITRTSGELVITVDPNLDSTMTDVYVRYGTDQTMNSYLESMNLPVPAGVDNLVYAITGYTDNTLVYYWLATGHSWGYWASQTAQSFTTLPPPGTVATPTFNPAPGTYTGPQSVAISSATAGASIRYTTDGTVPSATVGTLYSAPIPLGSSATVKAVAYKTGWVDSPVATGGYIITPPVNNTTTNIMLSSGNTVLTFINNVFVHRLDTSGPVQTYTYLEPAGGNKLILLPNVNTAGSRPLTLTDTAGNNAFNLQAAGVLNITDYANGPYIGKMETNAFGTGWTSTYEAPLSMDGAAWNLQATVYDSHYDNGAVYVPVGTVSTEVRGLSQNGFQVTYGSSLYSLCYGTVNGNLIHFWSWGGNDPTWLRTHSETWVVDPSGTSLTGTMEDTWQARSGSTTAYVRANVVGWR